MKLEKQVVSLALAKKLKKLRVKQDSYFYWDDRTNFDGWKVVNKDFFAIDGRYSISAFSVAEIGEMLPKFIGQERTDKNFLLNWVDEIVNHLEKAETEADARAKMLIYLLKNKLIKTL